MVRIVVMCHAARPWLRAEGVGVLLSIGAEFPGNGGLQYHMWQWSLQ